MTAWIHIRRLAFVASVPLVVGSAHAEDYATFRHAESAATAEAPAIDGDVLGDSSWKHAPELSGFVQTTPDAGQPASERTEVRVLYDDETLYVGVVCFDRDAAGIVVAESRRDSPLDETDSFQIVLDTYLDRRNGFVFGTNPAGLEYDGQVVNEGSGGGFGGGASSGGAAAAST